jgi:hypothetical protein
MEKQTAVEWFSDNVWKLKSKLENKEITLNKFCSLYFELYEQAKEMEKEQSQNYAIFAIRCDRTEMRILEFNDYIKLE